MSNKKNKNVSASKVKLDKKPEENRLNLTKADYVCMTVLTLIFLVLVFVNLGKGKAPSTSMELTSSGNHEVVLDFGEYLDVSTLEIFLGPYESRKVGLSVYNEVTGEWIVFDVNADIESVFDWNTLQINYFTRYLGLVFLDDKAVINEIVCKAPDGRILTPANISSYPELFDEQDLYPGDVTYMDGTMFDEVYHGRTAYEFLHGLTTYEVTHPHFGKTLISIGIAIFGMNPFGWRFMVALLGTLMVPVMYLFARRITKNTFYATSISLLLVFDFMHFGLSRIATIDIPVALFIMLMYYFMYAYLSQTNKESRYSYGLLALSGVSMAFGMATKFTGIYAGVGLAILFIGNLIKNFPKKTWKKLLIFCVSFFIVIPLIIYALSFIPAVETELNKSSNLIEKAYKGTKDMVDYHANLEATHYYSSPWYSWIYDGKPLLTSHDRVGTDKISSISIMGNPAIWWLIVPAFLYMIYRWIRYKDRKAAFLSVSYLVQYVPWILVSRCLFIYHYFPASIFGMMMIGYGLQQLLSKLKKQKYIVMGYLAVVIVMFIIFYPAISGLPVDQSYLMKLKWLPDWVITF